MNCHYTSSGECLNQGDCICNIERSSGGFSYTSGELGEKPQENTPRERKGLIEAVQEFAGVVIALSIAFGVVWAAVKFLK